MMLKISFDHRNELHFNMHRKQLFQFVTIFHNFIVLLFFKSNKCSPGEQKWYLTYILVFVSFDFGVKCNLKGSQHSEYQIFTFSKYLISYSRMMPLGRSGSCQDTAMLFFAVLPFFTTVIGDGAGNKTVTSHLTFHLKSSRKCIFLCDAVKPWCNVL